MKKHTLKKIETQFTEHMKKNPFVVTFTLFVIFVLTAYAKSYNKKDCDDVKSNGSDAYSYFRKAYNAYDLDDAQSYSKKGMNASSSAESEADDSDCDCDDAKSSASDAYTYGKKAYNSDKLSDAQYYAKKAMSSATEITDEAEKCESK